MDTENKRTHHAPHEYPQLTGHTDKTTLAFINISDIYHIPYQLVMKMWADMGKPRDIDVVRREVVQLFDEFGAEKLLYCHDWTDGR